MTPTGGAVKVDGVWYPSLADGTVRKDMPCKDAFEAMQKAHEVAGVDRGFAYRKTPGKKGKP